MKSSIELFSGSATVSKILSSKGFDTFTVDFNPNLSPDCCCSILNFYLDCIPRSVTFFWASPPCTHFSRAARQSNWLKTTLSYRNYSYSPVTEDARLSVQLLAKTIALILQLQPKVWFIENPVGRMPHFDVLRNLGHYRYAVNYADWGFPYSKETFIFTNQLLPLPTSIPKCHKPGLRSVRSSYLRSIVPPALIEFLIDHSSF